MKQQNVDSQQQQLTNPFLKNSPAVELTNKNYSLQPDLATGWVPKMKIIGPVPLNFDNRITDQLVETLIEYKTPYKIIYLGSRPHNTFKLHQQLSSTYPFKYEHLYKNNYSHLVPFYKKFYSEFQSKTKRPFSGMNPTLVKNDLEVTFNSQFESGNLDAAIKIRKGQYDLFLRVDSNTVGHLQWYYFKIKNISLKKITLRIVNFKRNKTLYQRGMRPFLKIDGRWQQGGNNITFKDNKLRYQFLLDKFNVEQITFKQLSFQYQFNSFNQEVQFAYCIPYPYSRVIDLINTLKKQVKQQGVIVQKPLCESLSGLQIPMLTITNPNQNQKKKCIFVIGRQHPGQSNGSFVMEGFLKWVLSNQYQAIKLRDHIILKVVPMLNPDGVIIGNYRTSFCGKDLNRLFRAKNCFMFPQVEQLKLEIINTKKQFKNKFLLFLDFHGHSVRKNAFTYGPGYSFSSNNYYKIRVFPKIISNRSQMFRYHSCTFKITEEKLTTARAVFSKYVPFCYTVQTSNWSYFWREKRTQIDFDDQKWQIMGIQIAKSCYEYDQILIQQEKKLKLTKKKQKKQQKRQKYEKEKEKDVKKIKKNLQTSKSLRKKSGATDQILEDKQLDQQYQKIFIDNSIIQQLKQLENIPQQHNQSDSFDSNGQDSQSDSQDLKEQDLIKFHKLVSKMMIQFENDFTKKNNKSKSEKQEKIQKMIINELKLIPKLKRLDDKKNKQKLFDREKQKFFNQIQYSYQINQIKHSSHQNSPPIKKLKSSYAIQIIPKKNNSIRFFKDPLPEKTMVSRWQLKMRKKIIEGNNQPEVHYKNFSRIEEMQQKQINAGQTQEIKNLRMSTENNKIASSTSNSKISMVNMIFPKTIQRKIQKLQLTRQKLQEYLKQNLDQPVKQTDKNIRIRNISSKVNGPKTVYNS